MVSTYLGWCLGAPSIPGAHVTTEASGQRGGAAAAGPPGPDLWRGALAHSDTLIGYLNQILLFTFFLSFFFFLFLIYFLIFSGKPEMEEKYRRAPGLSLPGSLQSNHAS